MDNAFIALLGFTGYLLPIPCLIWGWLRWWGTKPRLVPDTWRRTTAFVGLLLASLVGLFVFFVIAHANGLPEGQTKYAFAMWSGRRGFAASILALTLSLMGKGPVRFPASLASVGLAALWLISSITY